MQLDSHTIEIALEVAVLVFAAGGAWFELKALRKDISRLERKQEESNNVKTRTAIIEELNKAHDKRIAVLEERMLVLLASKDSQVGK